MLNSTVFGGWKAREALQKAYLALEVDSGWCVGGCPSWKETDEGQQRYKAICAINEQRKNDGLSHIGEKTRN